MQFKHAPNAKAVALKATHWIHNCLVKVKPADAWYQPDYDQLSIDDTLQLPEYGSQAHILVALNGDCLQEIFKLLELLDLTRVANVCKDFSNEAKRTFELKYRHLDLQSGSNFCGRPNDLEAMFCIFGPSIQTLAVTSSTFECESFIIHLIKQYCALKSLKLVNFSFKSTLKLELQQLHLKNCSIQMKNAKFFAYFAESLQKLQLEGCEFYGKAEKCIEQSFQNLVEASFSSNSGIDKFAMDRFITSNPKLEKLTIKDNRMFNTAKPLSLIGQHLIHLKELDFHEELYNFDFFNGYIRDLSLISTLKMLKLHFQTQPITSLINELATKESLIDYLNITKGQIDAKAMQNLTRLQKIKTVELKEVYGMTEELLIVLIKGIPLLHTLRLVNLMSNFKINCQVYNEILRAIDGRQGKLSIEITSYDKKVDVPQPIMIKNVNILKIDEELLDPSSDEENF